ncbi:MAG TPA: amidohydrolase/deacetylase family metallohydrolase [candidate division Zixibacteria bacterium]|nr:amidohydrolase/deacetylase family metallohydrolase [candidate division Zixibacteria bacterium]
MTRPFDLLLSGGTVLDPATGFHGPGDVAVVSGKIAAIGPSLPRDQAVHTLDVRGLYVTPGLIDFHVHSYWGVNPYGLDLDPICAATGVTATVDAGSAGPVNFPGFKRLIHAPSRARMLAFVALAQHGVLHAPGELTDLRFADPEAAARTVAENREIAAGIKVRLHRKAVGDNGREALRLAIEAGESCRAPVMVHIGDTGLWIEEIVDTLRPGDIVTHCYTPQQPAIVDPAGRLRGAVRRARERGVIFDVGHAGGHFDFQLVRSALDGGLAPDIISTDLHGRLGPSNPVVDLPTTMSKFLALGMSLDQVVAACTINAARAIGWEDRLGSVAVGREADLAVLSLTEDRVSLRDSVGGELTAGQRLAVRWTIRAGSVFRAPG